MGMAKPQRLASVHQIDHSLDPFRTRGVFIRASFFWDHFAVYVICITLDINNWLGC